MTTGPAAPQWHGEAGFFEIWFIAAFDRTASRAWWFRYTTFAPRAGAPRAALWAAVFEVGRPPRWGKQPVDVNAVHAAVMELARGYAAGRVELEDGPIAWELTIRGGEGVVRGPRWLEHVPTPTHAAHLRGEADVAGTVRIAGGAPVDVRAVATVKHLWGTRRVEELHWVYCPLLDEGGAFEATGVRVRCDRGPTVTPVWLSVDGREHRLWRVPGLFRHRVRPDGLGRLRVDAASTTVRIEAVASCDPATLAGYVYRDPSGFDVHVAQSDVAGCGIALSTRAHALAAWGAPRQLAGARAAIEIHQLDPLPGVRYVPWDGTRPSMVNR